MSFRPVRIAAEEGEGLLVFAGEALVAVLTKLSGAHGRLAGRWFLEAAFGIPDVRPDPVFETVEEAEAWFARHIRG